MSTDTDRTADLTSDLATTADWVRTIVPHGSFHLAAVTSAAARLDEAEVHIRTLIAGAVSHTTGEGETFRIVEHPRVAAARQFLGDAPPDADDPLYHPGEEPEPDPLPPIGEIWGVDGNDVSICSAPLTAGHLATGLADTYPTLRPARLAALAEGAIEDLLVILDPPPPEHYHRHTGAWSVDPHGALTAYGSGCIGDVIESAISDGWGTSFDMDLVDSAAISDSAGLAVELLTAAVASRLEAQDAS